jgi:hypothetical protein
LITNLHVADSHRPLLVGVSYVAIFIVSYHITFWVFGAAASLAWDYRPGVPQGVEAEHRVRWYEKPIGGWMYRRVLRKSIPVATDGLDEAGATDVEMGAPAAEHKVKPALLDEIAALPSTTAAPSPSDGTIAEISRVPTHTSALSYRSLRTAVPCSPPEPDATPAPTRAALLQRVFAPVRAVVNPITVTLIVALVIALVNDLKALFVPVESAGAPTWHGPDGRPPLAFVMDTGTHRAGCIAPLMC